MMTKFEVETSCAGYASETILATRTTRQSISLSEGKVVEVWDGWQFTSATVEKVADSVELVAIYFSDGSYINCTEETRWLTESADGVQTSVKTKDLRAGDVLASFQRLEDHTNNPVRVKLAVNLVVKQRRHGAAYTVNGLHLKAALLGNVLVHLAALP